jgi:hypothetical protein
MGNRIDDDLVPLDAVDDPVREDLQQKAAQVAGERRAQARKSEQELNGMVHVSEKPLGRSRRPLEEERCRFGNLLVGLWHETNTHG